MLELIEVGFLESFFVFLNPPPDPLLTFIDWAFVSIGFVIQYQVTRRCKRAALRRIFPGLLLAGVIWGECSMWAITGWDRLGVIIFYWPVACMVLGALAGWLAARLWGKRQGQNMQ